MTSYYTLPSTSPELDVPQKWKLGGHVEEGSMFIVPIEDCDVPFGVARLITTDENGILKFIWYSNKNHNVRGTFKPGWRNTEGDVYLDEDRSHATHNEYTGKDSGTIVKLKHVVMHGFTLTASSRLPMNVLRTLSSLGSVDWQLKQ